MVGEWPVVTRKVTGDQNRALAVAFALYRFQQYETPECLWVKNRYAWLLAFAQVKRALNKHIKLWQLKIHTTPTP